MVRSRCGSGLILAFAGVAFLAGSAVAEQATVTLKDGRTLTGELTSEDAQKVVLQIAGIATSLDREDIAKVEIRPSVEQEYRKRRAALRDDDVEGRLELARWLLDQRAMSLAQREAHDLQRRAPDHAGVRSLVSTVDAAIQLEQQGSDPSSPRQADSRSNPGRSRGTAAERSPAPAAEDQAEAPRLLDEDQITLIKVWELPADLSSTQARVRIPRPVVQEIFEKFREDPAVPRGRNAQRDFFGRSDLEQLGWIFDMATRNTEVREYYDDIQITGDPEALLDFRRVIYAPYIQRYFRRTFVETGAVPGLVVFGNERDNNAELYTNFFILSQLQVNGRAMINRSSPSDSLLLQWGLPREAARYPAPEAPGWRPFFNGLQDPNYARYVEWITSLYDTAGDYGIKYTPPDGSLQLSLPDGAGEAADGEAAPAR